VDSKDYWRFGLGIQQRANGLRPGGDNDVEVLVRKLVS
jgi:hypothetical protein